MSAGVKLLWIEECEPLDDYHKRRKRSLLIAIEVCLTRAYLMNLNYLELNEVCLTRAYLMNLNYLELNC